jgi:hypothetical protein
MEQGSGRQTLEERLPTEGKRTFLLVVRMAPDGRCESNLEELSQLLAGGWAITAVSTPSLTVTRGPDQDLLGLVFVLGRP